MNIFLAFISSFALSLLMVALVLRLSRRYLWFDAVNERKIHTGDIPRLGGVGFATAFTCIAMVVFVKASESCFDLRFLPITGAMLMIIIFGAIDDFRPLAPKVKLLIQIIAALCVVIAGYNFRSLFNFPIGKFSEFPLIIGCLLTFLWLVGLTNAMNLIDGVDGLAGGISFIICLTCILIFASFDNMGTVVILSAGLAGAIGGFLVFNLPLPRAKIFMGDSGSQFLGFMLAGLPILNNGSNGSGLPLPYAAALLLIPILDTTAAVWRRIRDGRPIDSPDRSHVHHKLMNLGFKAGGVIGILYCLQITLGILVILSLKTERRAFSLALLGSAYILACAFFAVIHYTNQAFSRRKAGLTDESAEEKHDMRTVQE